MKKIYLFAFRHRRYKRKYEYITRGRYRKKLRGLHKGLAHNIVCDCL